MFHFTFVMDHLQFTYVPLAQRSENLFELVLAQ